MIEYRSIPGFDGYSIGTDGTVLTYWTRGVGDAKHIGTESRVIKTRVNKNHGYVEVGLMRDGKQRTMLVHRLVLEAFVGPCPSGMEGCHDPDPNRQNNSLDNLRWDTRKRNHADKTRHGTMASGSRNGNSSLTDEMVVEVRRLAACKMPQAEIAKRVGASQTNVSRIIRRETWRHVA
jgi:hypothetical protein